MALHNIDPIVFSSSCTVYGQPKTLPVNEQSPLQPAESPYGNTKKISEEILFDTTKATSIKVISLRYFNPIGAHETAAIGELPIGVPNNLMPFITQTAAGIREKLSVFGNDYNTPDGTCIRDYIHVVDLAKAHVVALNRMLNHQQKKSIEYFNVGTGKGFSVLDVIKSFEKTSGQKLNYQIVGRRAGDVEQIWADPKFANEELGWQAEKSLDEMTKSAWNWQKKLSKIA
jgi:UDP-glucose 4-epimerase